MLVDTVTVSTQLSLASMSGNNSMHFLLTPYIVSLKIVFQCVFGTTQQPIPDVATHKVEVGAQGMFVKVMCESFHSMFISLVFPEWFGKNYARYASGDKTLRLWALADGTCLKTFEGHTASVLRLNFLSAGTQVSTACNACIYDFQSAEAQQTLYLWLHEHISFDCTQVSLIRQNDLQGTLSRTSICWDSLKSASKGCVGTSLICVIMLLQPPVTSSLCTANHGGLLTRHAWCAVAVQWSRWASKAVECAQH